VLSPNWLTTLRALHKGKGALENLRACLVKLIILVIVNCLTSC